VNNYKKRTKIYMPEIDFKKFPITRYQGSKRKILSWIYDEIKDLEFNTVLDACGGSGSVSYLFKKMGKRVTYNDKLKFNYTIGKALIQNQQVKFLEEDYQNLFNWIQENDVDDFITNTFRGVYYPTRENRWLDGMNHGILNMNHYHGQELDFKKSIAYYALFQACIIKRPFNLFHRKNLNIRTRDVERNFGNKVTWEKPFRQHFRAFIDEANSIVFNSGVECFATNQSIFEIENNYDLVYIDPPYIPAKGMNETSNYLKCYHFLEGLANYDEWSDLIDFDSINLRFKNANEQNEFRRENIIETFDSIFSRFRDSIIVFSYKEGGSPSIQTLVRLMRKYKTNVRRVSMHYTYALNRQNDDAKNREVLIIGI
jgi:adenine-specific DNA-methyltransferase